MVRNAYRLVISTLLLSLAACASSPPAPVIDRLPTSKTNTASSPASAKSVTKSATNKSIYKAGDWRPDTYLVKKGDTLFSIGLEHGYDYKEIAQANNIIAPYSIYVGQVLRFSALKDKTTNADIPSTQTNSDGVLITPINTDTNSATATSTTTSTITPNNAVRTGTILAINEPKAIREPYSEEAFKKPVVVAKPQIIKPTTTTALPDATGKPSVEPKTDVKPETKTDSVTVDDVDWAWPTKGKVTANFNEGGGKGIDIAGTSGQAIIAASAGKVIYSGSDLRGYGKLVIIKHNASYLSVYAHNSQISVKEGQQVSRGQKIAEMGNTDSNTVKLHFEIRRQGKSVDPSKYLSNN